MALPLSLSFIVPNAGESVHHSLHCLRHRPPAKMITSLPESVAQRMKHCQVNFSLPLSEKLKCSPKKQAMLVASDHF